MLRGMRNFVSSPGIVCDMERAVSRIISSKPRKAARAAALLAVPCRAELLPEARAAMCPSNSAAASLTFEQLAAERRRRKTRRLFHAEVLHAQNHLVTTQVSVVHLCQTPF